jgi:hypothetical protein
VVRAGLAGREITESNKIMTTTLCFTCHEDIPVESKQYAATFAGMQRFICRDCAEGIHDGNQVFAKLGVVGEFLGDCKDNETL